MEIEYMCTPGAFRTCDICEPKLRLRRATIEDCQDIYNWRNYELNRQYSLNSDKIDYEAHCEWFKRQDPKYGNHLLVGMINNVSMGVVRFVESHCEFIISIYLTPGNHNKGIGFHLLQAAIQWLNKDNIKARGSFNYVIAQILPDNIASIKTFQKCGFKEASTYWYLNIDEVVGTKAICNLEYERGIL